MKGILLALVSMLAWVVIALVTVYWFLLILALYLVHPLADPDRRIIHQLTTLWGRSLLALSGVRVEIYGRERLPKSQPVILMANHQSYVDVPVLFLIHYPFKWMADAGLFRIPVFGWSMGMAGYIPVWRGQARSGMKALERARRWLAKGISVFIFPTGTRSHTGVLGRFQTGGFRLAVSTGTPIVPVVVAGTRPFLPRGSWVFRPVRRIQIHILEPIVPSSTRPQEIRRLARKVREEMVAVYRRRLMDYR